MKSPKGRNGLLEEFFPSCYAAYIPASPKEGKRVWNVSWLDRVESPKKKEMARLPFGDEEEERSELRNKKGYAWVNSTDVDSLIQQMRRDGREKCVVPKGERVEKEYKIIQ